MNKPKQRNPFISNLIKIQRHLVNRIVWPYSFEHDSLIRWRAVILSSILIAGLAFGIFALIAAAVPIIEKNAWGLAAVDILGLILCLTFLFVHRIRFEIRASISVLMFFLIGAAIILAVGPLSGGPAWLFAFAVIAGVLMGGYAAFFAILMNAIFILVIGILISTGKFGNDFPFFNTPQAMIASGVNFIVLNAITAVSVSALVNGLFHIFQKKEDLADRLEKERFELIETKKSLESEINDRKQAQAEKIKALAVAAEAKKLALIGQVAGKMAHDFNNILGVIMGVSELSLLDCSDETINKNLELILNQTIRGRNLTKTLVAFAKPREPKQEYFKINEKIDQVLNSMRKDLENIEIRIDHGSDMPDVLADSGMIEHILLNLLQNSIHAASKTKHPRIMIRTYCLDKNIYFVIEDNGCGIPKEHLKNIYEPSFTLKGSKDVAGAYKTDIKGAGYGMANAKKYIEQHNGRISVESVVNSGTIFTISLPVVKNELSIEEKSEIQNEMLCFEKNILLVEDEQALSDVQCRILTQDPCSHTVDVAYTGQAAMDLFDTNQYDFVSLDYVLADKINGVDVYNYIREKNKTIPILFVSGNIEFLESIDDLKQKDMYIDHLSKPCMNIDYISGINKLFRKLRI